jgi:peptide/nickel transport system substrate-binding protein
LQVVEGQGIEIRYLVFNVKLPPSDQLAVRRSIAYLIDRQSIAHNVYNDTVQPLYSMVPAGLFGHIDSYKTEYGATPNPDLAKKELTDAGIATPVPITIWWTPTHYGGGSADEYTEIKRELEGSGLFKVTLKSEEWDQYAVDRGKDIFPAFQLGWFPDYPDADDYSAYFYPDGGFWNGHYDNPQIDKAIDQEKASTDSSVREAAFAKIQELAAKDAPTIRSGRVSRSRWVRDGVCPASRRRSIPRISSGSG